MSELTYEAKDTETVLETFEWDRLWIEHTENTESYRVLYIGDSISYHTAGELNARGKGEILFDNFATSSAVDNPYLKDCLSLFKKRLVKTDAVVFNNGLHGWHLEDESGYKEHYEEIIMFIKSLFSDSKIFVALTTSVRDTERDERVAVRNKAVCSLAEKHGVSVIDLFDITYKNKELLSDGVHFKPEGYGLIAEEIIRNIREG